MMICFHEQCSHPGYFVCGLLLWKLSILSMYKFPIHWRLQSFVGRSSYQYVKKGSFLWFSISMANWIASKMLLTTVCLFSLSEHLIMTSSAYRIQIFDSILDSAMASRVCITASARNPDFGDPIGFLLTCPRQIWSMCIASICQFTNFWRFQCFFRMVFLEEF